jgi:hypothetical protein
MSTKIHNGKGTAGMAPEPDLLASVKTACAAVYEAEESVPGT